MRTFLALIKTPMMLPTMKEEITLEKNLTPIMKPHWAMLIPLERASMGKKELMMEEEIPERRREKHKMMVFTQFMIKRSEDIHLMNIIVWVTILEEPAPTCNTF